MSRLFGQDESFTEKRSQADLLRRIFIDLGTTYIKFGQWLSVRSDFVSPDVMKELEKLQDRLPPLPFKTIKRIIEQETGRSLDDLFASIEPYPVSTASIAQVHRARLKTGETVAVKVQRPKLRRQVRVDLDVLGALAGWATARWPRLSVHRADEVLADFKTHLFAEMDFIAESNNQDRLHRLFEDTPWVQIANVYRDYTTKRLLVMEYIDGVKLSQQEHLRTMNLDRSLLAKRLSDCMFRQIFDFRFYQSDPHPGNILFKEDHTLGLIDFGIMYKLDHVQLGALIDWIYAGISRDADLMIDAIQSMGMSLEHVNMNQLRADCMDYLDEIYYQPVDRISFRNMFAIGNRIQYRHNISISPTILYVFKTISTLEGVVLQIDPGFDWRKDWGPKLAERLEERYSPGAMAKDYQKALKDYNRLFLRSAQDIGQIIDRLKNGNIGTECTSPGRLSQPDSVQRGLQKLSVSIVFSSIILGLFYIGRGQGFGFMQDLLVNIPAFGWAIVLLMLVLFYLRR